jgi:hypothetical protein
LTGGRVSLRCVAGVRRGIDALDMPGELGERVQAVTNHSVPLFESPDSNGMRWVLLVAPHTAPAVPGMSGLDVDHIRDGRCVDLPPSRFGPHRLCWINAPDGLSVPDFATVVHTILQAT